jgi:hypothetical protein
MVSVSYEFASPRLEATSQGAHVTAVGCDSHWQPGKPGIPVRTARVLIPPGYTVEKAVAVPSAEPVTMHGTWQIEAGGRQTSPLARRQSATTARAVLRTNTLPVPYPSATAELLSVQRLAGYSVALVRLFPVQHHPTTRRLVFTPRLDLQLSLSPLPSGTTSPVRSASAGQAAKQIAAFVDNPELLASLPPQEPAAPTESSPAFDYLLITSSNLASAFQPLLDQKTRDGLKVKVETIEAITRGVAGRDTPEKIRNCIRQAYTNSGISYVLLGGDATVVPCRYAHVPMNMAIRDPLVPSDLYYACLDGSWNNNGDDWWGESADGENGGEVDLLAEVYVGRAPVHTPEQVACFVEKTVRYQATTSGNAADFLLLAASLGEFAGGMCQGADMFRPLLPLLEPYRVNWLDDQASNSARWTGQDALKALNRSPHVVLYNGYGDADTQMRLRTADLGQLTNQWPFLAYSSGCRAGQFDHGKFWSDSIGEALINSGPHGAFAAVLNARLGWFEPHQPWRYSGEFQAKFFQELLSPGHANLGIANQRGKERLVGLVERKGPMTYRWCYYGITLFGDPHVSFRAAQTMATGPDCAHPQLTALAEGESQPQITPARPMDSKPGDAPSHSAREVKQ